MNSDLQQRTVFTANELLMVVAQAKVNDMAERNYFHHTDPDGFGANHFILKAGYPLPPEYSRSDNGNNVECLAGGQPSAEDVFNTWLHSPHHRSALLGEIDFYRAQNEFGIGYIYQPVNTKYHHYWCVLTARQM